jgi:hypothetical protein
VEQLDRAQALLLELRSGLLAHRLPREVGERRTGPEIEREPQVLGGVGRASGRERGAGLLREPLEAREVELGRVEPEAVAGAVPLDPLRAERLTQAVDVDLERGDRGARRLRSPERVDQPVARDDRVRMQEEKGQQGALLRRSQR